MNVILNPPTPLFLTVLSEISLQFLIQYFTDAVSKALQDFGLFGVLKRQWILVQRADGLQNKTEANVNYKQTNISDFKAVPVHLLCTLSLVPGVAFIQAAQTAD